MKAEQNNLLVGAFAVLSLAAMAVLILWLFNPASGPFPWRQTYAIHVAFDRNTIVRPGTPAMVSGIPIGVVRQVVFADPESLAGGVRVELAIDGDRRLRRGSWARSSEIPARARATLEIVPGPRDEPALEPGATIRGEVLSSMSALLSPEVVSSIEGSAVRVGDAADQLAAVLGDFRAAVRPMTPASIDVPGSPPGNLMSALARLDASLRSLNELLGDDELRNELKGTVQNLYGISQEGRQLVADARVAFGEGRTVMADLQKFVTRSQGAVEGVERRVSDAGEKLSSTLQLASALISELHAVVGKINRSEGTLGKMLSDDQLYEALLLTIRRTQAATP